LGLVSEDYNSLVTFWLNVGLAYLLLLGVGMAIGVYFGSRRRRGGGGGAVEPLAPEPLGPSLALDCPPLGSAFDRALLPNAFGGSADLLTAGERLDDRSGAAAH
jgi:hypothetical protein